MRELDARPSKLRWTLLRVASALLLTSLLMTLRLDYLEFALYDLRMRLPRPQPVASELHQVIIDSTTVRELDGSPDLGKHQKLLSLLHEQEVKAVVYAMDLEEIAGSEQEQRDFVQATRELNRFFIQTNRLEMEGEEGRLKLDGGLLGLKATPGPRTSDTTIFAQDGVTRRALLSYQKRPLLHYQLAALVDPEIVPPEELRGAFYFLDSDQIWVDFRPRGRIPRSSFSSLLNDQEEISLRGKIVFVGTDLELSVRDYVTTPYSREVNALPVVELHAQITNSILLDRGIVRAAPWVNFLCIFLITLFTIQATFLTRPLHGLLWMVVGTLGYSAFALGLFSLSRIWIPLASPLVAIFICYYFVIPYRLIIETRRSWEYFEKNKLLTEVEQLKNNFISMMSHDLKTPLARIQGMTDIIDKDSKNLSPASQEALKTIRSSSADLIQFITSILQFSRVEAQGVQLHMQSKDINTLIDEVCGRLSAEPTKAIQFRKDLAPLFAVRMDVDLIRQVLTNIIENAIKYSDDSGVIEIRSFEEGSFIGVEVRDHGRGINEREISKVFMKFFRSQEARHSPVRGSGLGLYLAKYFIDLHQGKIEISNHPEGGCLVRFCLPIV